MYVRKGRRNRRRQGQPRGRMNSLNDVKEKERRKRWIRSFLSG